MIDRHITSVIKRTGEVVVLLSYYANKDGYFGFIRDKYQFPDSITEVLDDEGNVILVRLSWLDDDYPISGRIVRDV